MARAALAALRSDGWLKVLGPDGSAGPNLKDSEEYCRLWQ
jgi:hypothetical protein